MRILVYRTGHLGDTICAIPAFRLIRQKWPGAHITLLCDSPATGRVAAADVVQPLGIFDDIVSYVSERSLRTIFALYRIVRRQRPKLTILLPQVRESEAAVFRKIRFFRHCGVQDIRGFTLPWSSHHWHSNEPDRLVQILRGSGIAGEKPRYDIPVHLDAQARIRIKLTATGIDPDGRFTVFCGGGKAPTQHWPLERYASVLSSIAAEPGWPVVAMGTPAELNSCRTQFGERSRFIHFLDAGLTVPEIFELFRQSSVYVGNDTGPMHAAAAVACPVAVIMSGRNAPGSWDPDVEQRLVFRHRTSCEDCFLQECVKEQHRCMTAIKTDDVIKTLIPFLHSLPSPHSF